MGGLGKARVAQEGAERGVEQNVGRLEVAVQDARAARVQVDERLQRLEHRPQPLAPRERLGRGVEMAHRLQVGHVPRLQLETRLQAAADH